MTTDLDICSYPIFIKFEDQRHKSKFAVAGGKKFTEEKRFCDIKLHCLLMTAVGDVMMLIWSWFQSYI